VLEDRTEQVRPLVGVVEEPARLVHLRAQDGADGVGVLDEEVRAVVGRYVEPGSHREQLLQVGASHLG
jgi:hypothetical protein